MGDPITVSLALGVAGNLATNVVSSIGGKIENTRVGKTLSKLGMIAPGFDERLRKTIEHSAEKFLTDNPSYCLPEIHSFLQGKALAKDIKDMLLEQRGLDGSKVMERLETYVGVPLNDAPESWPNRIEPSVFVEKLFNAFTDTLGAQADDGLLWIGNAIAQQGVIIRGISTKLDSVLEECVEIRRLVSTDGSDEFEQAYLAHVAGRAQRISTPGARELRGINQSLSVAYISLNLKSSGGAEAVKAEDFLSQHSHVAIRGPAGSGKTTLLNWLITKCKSDDGDEKWQGYVPFFVPLRTVARLHSGPPALDRLVEYSVDKAFWLEPTPKGWINGVLARNRAILMIDGVDELPPSRRVEFWDWIGEFVELYPESRVIITSRALPGAPVDGSINDQWNPPKAFVDAQLQGMSDADVTNFIHHWHDSIDPSKLDEQELTSLAEARSSLPVKLEDAANRRIRELCNTPLLCAMICVLHWREEGYLPRQRVEVYERCCDMLIEARDHKRDIQPPPGAISAMSKSDKEMVLQQLAIEMMHNRDDTDGAADDTYRIEISREKALAWILPRIARFQSDKARQATPTEVLDFLVERTGLLREPAKDLIDFPHRTFQEFLAACAAGADSQEAMLAKQADDDQWHETIMLAAGTNTGGVGFGRKLIETLIKRGERHSSPKDRSQKIRKTCFALALGCLENLRQQDEDLRESVLSHLEELVPPRSDDDARILSVAGDAAVSHLSHQLWKDENTATIAACARALRMVGTTEALKAINRGYATDPRPAVATEVCRTGAFDYNSVPVVSNHVAETGRLPHFVNCNDIALIVGLENLKDLQVDLSDAKGLERIGELTSLTSIDLDAVTEKAACLHELPASLTSIRIMGSALPDGNWASRLSDLKVVSLIGIPEEDVVRLIDEATEIESLAVVASDFTSIDTMKRLSQLSTAYLAGLRQLSSISGLANHHSLNALTVEDCPKLTRFDFREGFSQLEALHIEQPHRTIDFVGSMPADSALKSLVLADFNGVEDLSAFADTRKLEKIELFGSGTLRDISAIEHWSGLREIALSSLGLITAVRLPTQNLETFSASGIPTLMGDSFQEGLPSATNVTIERCVKIESVDFLSTSPNLSNLRLTTMPRISTLSALKQTKKLSTLDIIDCDGIDTLSDIEGLPIEELSLISMHNIRDIDRLSSLQSLRSLTIAHCDHVNDLSFALDLPNLETIWLLPGPHSIHVPEALQPKVSRNAPSRLLYFHERKPWWTAGSWVVRDPRYSLPRRIRPYRTASYRWP